MLARGVGDAREGGRQCSRGGSAMLVRGDLQGHRTHALPSLWFRDYAARAWRGESVHYALQDHALRAARSLPSNR